MNASRIAAVYRAAFASNHLSGLPAQTRRLGFDPSLSGSIESP
jgi:hypothetical protein